MGWIKSLLVLIILGLIAYFGFRHFHNAQQTAAHARSDLKSRPATVTAVAAKIADMKVYLNAIGTVTPRNVVIIKPRIDGQLMRVLFNEGQYVREGELLAEIDARPYQVQLAQAQGQMATDQALLRNAELDSERYRTLLAQDSVAKQQTDTQASLVRQYQGKVQSDQSQIDNARLQLTYTRITSPISGRIGLRQVDVGNIVHQSDINGLLSIAQVKPINVIFSIPQDNLSSVLTPTHKGEKLPVEVYGRDQQTRLADGVVSSVDNQIDTTTGTVKVKAQFTNDNEALFPNQFVNVRILLDLKKGAMVVPNSAIQRGSQGTFVYVVKPDQTVTVKPVRVTVSESDLSAIEGEIAAGDLIVTDGADKLREGTKVQVATANGSQKNAGGNKSQQNKPAQDGAPNRQHRTRPAAE